MNTSTIIVNRSGKFPGKTATRGSSPGATQQVRARGALPAGVPVKALKNIERNVNAGMHHVVHKVAAILIYHVDVVVVVPAQWPPLVVSEPIAAVLEAVIAADHLGTPHVERVALTKMRSVAGVRNASILAAAAVAGNG